MGEFTIPDLGVTKDVPKGPGDDAVASWGRPPDEVDPRPYKLPSFVEEGMRDEKARRLKQAQENTTTLPAPDEAAALRTESRARALPFTAVLADPKVLEPKPPPISWDSYADNQPLSDILLDPSKAVLVHDEADRLAKLAGLDKEGFAETRLGQMWESGSLGVERDELWFKRGLAGGVSTPEEDARLKTIDERLRLLPSADGVGGQILEGVVQQGPRMLSLAKGAAAGAAVGGAALLPGGPGAAAAGAAAGARVGTAAVSAEQAVGNAYAEFVGAGMSHDVAWPIALVAGGVIAGLDTLSFGMLAKFPALKSLAGMKGLERLTPETVKAALAAAAKDSRFARIAGSLLKDMATEGGTESLQELVQISGDFAGAAVQSGVKTPTLEEAAGRTLMSGVVGGAVGGVAGGFGTVTHEFTTRVGVAEKSQQIIDRLYDLTEDLKSSERAPDVVEKYGNEIAKTGPVKHLTMPVEELSKLLEANKDSPAVKAWLNRNQKKLDDAATSGARLAVPLGEFIAYIRPLDKSRTLNQVIGVNDEMSPAEAKELRPQIQKAKKEMADAAKRKKLVEEGSEGLVFADIEKRLKAVGMTNEAAGLQAQLVTSGISTLARRAGKNPWETYRSAGLQVVRLAKNARMGVPLDGAKSLNQADPKGVKNKNFTGPFGTQYLKYEHPESPLKLQVIDEVVNGNSVRQVASLSFNDTAAENVNAVKKYGSKGYSTALYLRALADAKDANVGFASDTMRTDATERMYARLKRLGVPVEKADDELGRSHYYISAEALQAADLDAVWEKLKGEVKSPRSNGGQFANIAPEEIEAALSGLHKLQQNTGEVRGTISFDEKRDWFRITLTGKANLSTFLHESSHFLLEIMRKLAAESPDLAGDLRILEEWAGVKPGEEWSDAALEKFARGMETYFGEGRAPSSKLAAAFATFKTWILHVYRTLTNLNAPLTDEVRSVMDRMLATEEEINARRLELGYFPNEMLLGDGEMSAEEQQHYRDLYEQGAKTAQAQIDREAIAALRREQSQDYKRIAEEVDAELDKHPVIALREWLATGERKDGGLPMVDFTTRKFDREAVIAKNLGPGIVPKLKDHLADVGGIDPGEVAPFFGFKSGSEMLERLATTPARATLKSALVKAEFTKLYPAYGPGKAWIEKTALEKLHGADAISNALEIELRVLYRKAKLAPPNSPALVAHQAAKSAVAEMKRKDMHPALHREAETRLLREMQKALAAKDFEAAAEATRKRLYNRALWQEMQTAVDRIDAAEKQVKRYASDTALGRLGKSTDAKLPTGERVAGVIRDAVKVIVEGVGFAPKSEVSSNGTLDAYLSKLEEAALPVSVDVTIRERPLVKWEELTYTEAKALQDAVKNLSTIAHDLDVIRVKEGRAHLADIADRVESDLKAAGLLERLGRKGEQPSALRHVRAEIAKPETILEDLGPTLHKLWMDSAEQGQFERDRRFRQRRTDLQAIGKKWRVEGWEKRMHAKHKGFDGLEYTGAEVFAMLLNFGSESNRDKLIRGYEKAGRNWSDAAVLKFIHEVFPDRAAYDYAQALWDYISSSDLWEESARVREAISGVRPEKVEALPVYLPDGSTVKGGYYPLVYDRKVSLREAEETEADALDAMHDANPLNMFAANGFTKNRTGYAAPILLNPNALAAHLYEVDHFIANAQGIIDRHKMLNHPRIKTAIAHAVGHEYWESLRNSNNFIAADGRRLTREFLQLSSTFDKLIYHNALLTMGGNLLSGVNQVVNGVPATLAKLGPRGVPAFAKALLKFAQSPFQMWKDVNDLSGEIQGMEFHYDRDLRLVISREISGEKWDHVKSRIAAVTMTPVVFGQKMVNVLTWQAAYDIALTDGLDAADAIARANSVVRQSQSTSAPKDFAAVQRSHDGLMRVLTSLASYTFTLNDLVMPRRLTKQQLVGHTARLVMLLTTTAMLKALFDAIFPKLAEKDEERLKGVEKMAAESEIPGLLALTESAMDVLGNVPVVGRTAQAVVSGRSPRYASWVETGIKALQATPDAFADKGLNKSELRAVVEAVGLVAGVPTRHVLFGPGEFWMEYLNGNIEDAPWAFFQELALVRPGQKGDH